MPSSRVLSFTDPFAYQSAFRSVDVELFPTVKGTFRAELTQVSLSKLWIHGAHEDLPRVYVGMVKPHRAAIGFLTRPDQPAMQHCGMAVLPGDIVINDTDLMYRRTEANCDWGSMSLPRDDLDASCKAVAGREYSGSPLKHPVRPAPELMSRLLKIHEMVGQLAKTTPDILSLPEVARALEQELILVMIRCLTEGRPGNDERRPPSRHDHRPVRRIPGRTPRPAAVSDGDLRGDWCGGKNAARRLRGASGNGPDPLSVPAQNASCAPRLRADPSTTTVTRVATDHGFWELGRFSVAYHGLFGESPSESLRRPAD